jgi:hypothetical protein
MKNNKVLLCNGCSHTFGSECDTSWPTEISKLTGFDYENLALPGTSNQSILRRTVKYILENEVRVGGVAIGWTTHERFELSVDGNITNYSLGKRDGKEEENKFYKYADLHIADWELGKEHTQLYMYMLQTFLQSKNIPYVFFNMYNIAWKHSQDYMYNSIDFSKYYLPNQAIIENYLLEYPDKFTETKHAWDPIIHQMIAKDIANSDAFKGNIL